MSEKKERMMSFWSESVLRFKNDPQANTKDVWLRVLEIDYVSKKVQECGAKRVLDFGCANGFTTLRLAELHPNSEFKGMDINPDMIRVAKETAAETGSKNAQFELRDIVERPTTELFDFVFGVRVFQNMESAEKQKQAFDALSLLVRPGGLLVCVESYGDGYDRINNDRARIGLDPMPVHPHLTLLTRDFDDYAASKMRFVARDHAFSTYYLVTRLAYTYLAKVEGEPIDYNHPLHQVATRMPQIGDYGTQRVLVLKKE